MSFEQRQIVLQQPGLLAYRAALGRRRPETAPFVLSRSAAFKSAAVRTFATDRGTLHQQTPETFSWTRARA
jgi:hypothetical protein